ncbi:MAG: hypothetical protein R3C59_19415 [Planctomycetaceae bacterium]
MRQVHYRYQDPLEVIWLHAATRMGMQVERSTDVFAAWDGRGVLTIGTPETLDADDSVAQMILHETCHALIEGPESFTKPDWGVQIDNPAHRVREHATLRLQAALTAPYGLRLFFAATTNFRRYYDQLPEDPLQGHDEATELARAGWQRATSGPWSQPLTAALETSAAIARLVAPAAVADSLWSQFGAHPSINK